MTQAAATTKPDPHCLICRGSAGDAEFQRIEVWQDSLWRLTVSLEAEVPGFASSRSATSQTSPSSTAPRPRASGR